MHLLTCSPRRAHRCSSPSTMNLERKKHAMRIHKPLLAIIAIGGLLFSAAPAASASPAGGNRGERFAASATSYQNAAIAAVMARIPGGSRVSPGRVQWDQGRIIFGVAASPHGQVSLFSSPTVDNCSYGYACVFTSTLPGAVEGGACESSWMAGGSYYCPIYQLGFGSEGGKIRSWVNFTSYRAWLQENDSHTNPGNEYCETPRISGSTPSVSDDFTGPNEEDGWIWMSNNTAHC